MKSSFPDGKCLFSSWGGGANFSQNPYQNSDLSPEELVIILLMEEIMPQLVDSLSHYLLGV